MERLVELQPATCPFWLRFSFLAPESALLPCQCFKINLQKMTHQCRSVSISYHSVSFESVRQLAQSPFSWTGPTGYSSNDAVLNHHVTFAWLEPLIKSPAHKLCKLMPCANTRYITRSYFGTREVKLTHPSQIKATQKYAAPRFRKKLFFLISQASLGCLSAKSSM